MLMARDICNISEEGDGHDADQRGAGKKPAVPGISYERATRAMLDCFQAVQKSFRSDELILRFYDAHQQRSGDRGSGERFADPGSTRRAFPTVMEELGPAVSLAGRWPLPLPTETAWRLSAAPLRCALLSTTPISSNGASGPARTKPAGAEHAAADER